MDCVVNAGMRCTAQEAASAPVLDQQAAGFEQAKLWLTAPVEELKVVPQTRRWSNSSKLKGQVKARTNSDLYYGAKKSGKNVTEGKSSLYWADHTKYPTLHSLSIKGDWEGASGIAIDIYSESATGEVVVIAFLSDSEKTPWKDYYYFPLKIDWEGAKTIELPLSEFDKLNSPVGWQKIEGMYFFTKAFGCEPNPYTGLYLDNMKLLEGELKNDDYKQRKSTLAPEGGEYFVMYEYANWQDGQLNHNYPELADNKRVYAPYAYQTYCLAERALFKYYPKFVPGYISYDQNGKAYIYNGRSVQHKLHDGKWEMSSLREPLAQWSKAQGWKGLKVKWNAYACEKAVRTDKDGDVYVIAFVEPVDPQNIQKRCAWQDRTALLLHSDKAMKKWQVYKLPGRCAEFEKLDGNNQECLQHPPLMLLGDNKYFRGSDQAGYLLITRKTSEGKLEFEKPVKFSESCIGVAQHSGGGNQVITRNNKAYIVYSFYAKKNAPELQKLQPEIPADHPGLKQDYIRRAHKAVTQYSKDGVPAFACEYDFATKKLSKPVYVGSGGGGRDNHNWAAITVDPKGYLHVIINGHHNPVNYTRSIKPGEISKWTDPEYVLAGTKEPNLSYATLNCDKEGNLYTIHRSTKDVYNNHLGLYVKPAGKPWQSEKTLVTPYRVMYRVWAHKAMYNPATDEIALTYFSQPSMKQLTRDQYEYDIFFWPDNEKKYHLWHKRSRSKKEFPVAGGDRFACSMMAGPASELTTLIKGKDDRWRVVVSEDLK